MCCHCWSTDAARSLPPRFPLPVRQRPSMCLQAFQRRLRGPTSTFLSAPTSSGRTRLDPAGGTQSRIGLKRNAETLQPTDPQVRKLLTETCQRRCMCYETRRWASADEVAKVDALWFARWTWVKTSHPLGTIARQFTNFPFRPGFQLSCIRLREGFLPRDLRVALICNTAPPVGLSTQAHLRGLQVHQREC